MTILETANRPEDKITEAPEEQIQLPLALPRMVWVAGILFVTNVVIGIGMWITPSLDADPYGREVRAYDASSTKASPFTETVDTTRRTVRLAAKARPVTFVSAPEADMSTYASLDIPRSSPTSNELDLPRSTSRHLELPRTSRVYQQLDMPVRTERAVFRSSDRVGSRDTLKVNDGSSSYEMPRSTYTAREVEMRRMQKTGDVAPRRTSEREKNFVVIN